jgi:hypothetical protein
MPRQWQQRAKSAPIVGIGIRQGHLSPVVRQPHRRQAGLRRSGHRRLLATARDLDRPACVR